MVPRYPGKFRFINLEPALEINHFHAALPRAKTNPVP
jgi:hypothetical protein